MVKINNNGEICIFDYPRSFCETLEAMHILKFNKAAFISDNLLEFIYLFLNKFLRGHSSEREFQA